MSEPPHPRLTPLLYYVDTVGKNTKAIQEYTQNQLQEDMGNNQVSMKEFCDPFMGDQYFKSKK